MQEKHTEEAFLKAVEAVLSQRQTLERHAEAPIKEWTGGEDPDTGDLILPHPTYQVEVQEFFTALGEFLSLWTPPATDYLATAGRFLDDHDAIGTASPDEVKALLTWVLRSERFSDGFWGEQLKSGRVVALLDRLDDLYQSGENTPDKDTS